jgi:hypothetical protein
MTATARKARPGTKTTSKKQTSHRVDSVTIANSEIVTPETSQLAASVASVPKHKTIVLDAKARKVPSWKGARPKKHARRRITA